ncbi:MAG: hypothetical protein MJK12_14205 [Colwellia sp.]|nr:hypothetical protein [Colwellia sp.]
MSSLDSAHGEYSIELEEGIICLTLDGEFNVESVSNYVKELQILIKSLHDDSFLMLVNNLKLIGATPDAYQESNKHNNWLATQNLLGKATVFPSNFLISIDNKMVPAKRAINHQNFHSIDEARHWLKTLKQRHDKNQPISG